ncbi:MAG: SUMF1/EgtB/PvdO family nonheme iron enzyme [Treponema sp.]|jgi:formylglycine-generating enzyme required for sulfatase activity|nr:SUMF1/EgtB/PvdO family nonheme iron enzyme [Treponema sp.]
MKKRIARLFWKDITPPPIFYGSLCLCIIFLAAGCSDGNDVSEPELAKWAGTWNSMTNYLDEPWLQATLEEGAAAVSAKIHRTVTTSQLKGVFAEMLKTDFKSCVINDDVFTVYTEPEAASTGTSTKITYTFKEKKIDGESEWYAFEGDQAGPYKYLIALLPEQHSTDTAEHFHFRYGNTSFDGLAGMSSWMGTLTKSGTTQAQIKASLQGVINELPWGVMLPNPSPLESKFKLITGGTFLRGSPDDDLNTAANEHPQHQVRVSSFYISRYEVTQKEWKDVMGLTVQEQHVLSGQSQANFRGSGDTLPINFVSWYDAVEFCNRLSLQEGLTPAYTITTGGPWNAPTVDVAWNYGANGYRLPTEAEWEYACRAGTTTRYNTGETEAALAAAAWYGPNSTIEGKQMLHPVGTKTPNALGLYDMHGNVWEYCWDLYVADYSEYAANLPQTDPKGGTTGENRVIRGGAFNNAASFQYSARRSQFESDNRGQNCGFRLVRSYFQA